MNDWQTEIGCLVRQLYKDQGYSDVLIIIGCIDSNDDINTQIWYPYDTDGDFDIRFMVFAILDQLFQDYRDSLNEEKNNLF